MEKAYGYSLSQIVKDHYNYGHKIYALDEEALTIASKKQYMKLNYYKKNEKYLSRFFKVTKTKWKCLFLKM